MITVARADVDRLLERHGIASTAIQGTDTQAAASGGRVATITASRPEDGSLMTVTIGETRAEGPIPLDETHARSMIDVLQSHQQLPAKDPSFDRMVIDLLLKISEMYVQSRAHSLVFESVHLHPASYHVGRVVMRCEAPLHVKPRRETNGNDRRVTFTQRHRTDQRFRE